MTSPSDPGVSELLPCPFCGGPVDVEETRPASNGQRFWGVTCRNTLNVGGTCAIEQIPSGSRETAIARWNARAIPAVVVPDDDRPSREFLENYVEGFAPGERSAALFGWREGRRHLREHSRPIPANLGPGEGIAAVVISDMENIRHLTEKPPRIGMLFGADDRLGACHRIACRALRALRANQGGAEHGKV